MPAAVAQSANGERLVSDMAEEKRTKLVKATLTHLDSLESVPVLWNPRSYHVERTNRFAAMNGFATSPAGFHYGPQFVTGRIERFATRLLLDGSRSDASPHDLRSEADRLERWAQPGGAEWLPARLLFAWGHFRFRGVIESLRQDWIRFDASGAPLRGWVDLVLRRTN